MATKIRMTRIGRHKRPFFRVIVSDSQSPRDGRFLEILGTYDPLAASNNVRVNKEKVLDWIQRGAVPSDTVKTLLSRLHFFKQEETGVCPIYAPTTPVLSENPPEVLAEVLNPA